jgi:GNAT superfamily N-acetyltransferase
MAIEKAGERQRQERDRATFEAWGGPLPVDRYLAAEARLRAQSWSRAASALWLLRPEGGEAVCSCETYRMASRFLGTPGHTYGIASVYTDPAHRRRGHATVLLEELGRALREEDPRAQAMVLFSDVPVRVYEAAGFVPRPAVNLVYPALAGDPAGPVDQLLDEAQAPGAVAGIPFRGDRFVLAPVPAQVGWHLERERIYAESLGRPRPPAWGARAGAGTALWTADYAHGQLLLLVLHAPGPAEAAALLACAQRTAWAAGLAQAVLWRTPGPEPGMPVARDDRTLRPDSVPMIRPLLPELRGEDWDWICRAVWV